VIGRYGVLFGHPYPFVPEMAMPRIHDAFLHSVFFVYPSMQAARRGQSAGGTGFLVCIKFKENSEYAQIYAVTNKHVVESCGSNVVLRLNSDEGVECLATVKGDWVPHPLGTYDISVLPLDMPDCNTAHRRFIVDELFLTESRLRGLDIGPGDDTFMAGRFIGHEGKVENIVPVRFGNIAALPNEPIRMGTEDKGANFLVEMRSISGYSGSPVFVFIDPNRPRPPMWLAPALPPYNAERHGPFLLGIDAGHIETQLEIKNAKKTGKIGTVSFITAMSVVVPAWHLSEILYGDDFVNQREKEDREITEKKNKGFVVPDSGG
jgi:hypothetical protein